jgi:hypothetical protein
MMRVVVVVGRGSSRPRGGGVRARWLPLGCLGDRAAMADEGVGRLSSFRPWPWVELEYVAEAVREFIGEFD